MKNYIRPEMNIRSFDRVFAAKLSDPKIAAYAEWMQQNNGRSASSNVTVKKIEAYSFN